MKKKITLSAILLALAFTPLAQAEDLVAPASKMTPEQMQDLHEKLLQKLQQTWNQTFENVDAEKIITNTTSLAANLTKMHPLDPNLIVLHHAEFQAAQQKLLRRWRQYQILQIRKALFNVYASMAESPQVRLMIQPLATATQPMVDALEEMFAPQLEQGTQLMKQLVTEWKNSQQKSVNAEVVQQD